MTIMSEHYAEHGQDECYTCTGRIEELEAIVEAYKADQERERPFVEAYREARDENARLREALERAKLLVCSCREPDCPRRAALEER